MMFRNTDVILEHLNELVTRTALLSYFFIRHEVEMTDLEAARALLAIERASLALLELQAGLESARAGKQ